MYYKIENKNSEVFKKLHELRTNELMMTAENRNAVEQKVGLKFKKFFGNAGQQNFRRVTQYTGFVFLEPEKVDLKTWKLSNDGMYLPNTKTKAGKEMKNFLCDGLQSSDFAEVFYILKLEYIGKGKFTLPYIEIVEGKIILFLDDNQEPLDENLIEITKKEFNLLLDKVVN